MMMKNRAGLLAISVLVVATILMVFFVLPYVGKDAKPIGDAINQAGSEVQNTIADNAQKAGTAAQKTSEIVQPGAQTAQALAGMTGSAVSSLTELKALFADGKGPTEDVFAAAKTKVLDALQAVIAFAAPQGADPVTTALVDKAHDGAGKALGIIQSLPENIADAATAIDKSLALVNGSDQGTGQVAGGPVKPAFDVLRVEPDGSTVIAGSAEPGSKLQIMDGNTVITTTDVGPSGDFAAVLDNPLAIGDHELVLKATGKDGNAILSDEVATISVPKGDKSQLLAMVSKPGTASRIITAPTAKQSRVASNDASAPSGDAAAQAGTAVASAEGATQGTPVNSADAAADVMVTAVEIENDRIFVAGTTRPNAKVRAYADDKPIGEIVAGGDGHFVVEGKMPLAVGDHKIRVDVVNGDKVLVRTSVNFNRPEGNQVTVAAQTPPTLNGDAVSMVPLDQGQLGKLKDDAGKAFALLKGLFAGGKQPGAEELAAARSGTEIALKSLSEFRPAIDASAALKSAASAASNAAAKALAFLQTLPKDAKSVGNALANIDQMMAEVIKPLANAPDLQATVLTADGSASEPKSYEQAPLAANNTAVIIRHGDTLWQISRRTYGQGVRYTTIYLANQDKINNPDRILPGQVFGLPKEALPNALELHRKRMSGQQL